MLQPSDEAPSSWRIDLAEAKVRELVLEVKPDFVFFQELPGMVPFVEDFDLIPANTTSHSGVIATIARKEIFDDLTSEAIGRFAVMTKVNSIGLTLANVHLAPGTNGDYDRLRMMNTIKNRCETPALAIIGDTNTRLDEEPAMEKIGLTGTKPSRPTWDSKRNLFHDDGRKYTAYYTRHFKNESAAVTNIVVWDSPIEHDGKEFFLSDHHAMSGMVEVML